MTYLRVFNLSYMGPKKLKEDYMTGRLCTSSNFNFTAIVLYLLMFAGVWLGGGGGMLSCVGDHILQESTHTLCT